jgi:hypothetical protein
MKTHLSAMVLTSTMALAGLVAPAGALAAPPPNDEREDATQLNPPGSTTGTLVDATAEAGEPSACGSPDEASVWYRFTQPAGGRLVILVDTAGDLDAVVGLFHRVRSELQSVECQTTNRSGQATFDDEGLQSGGTYFIRVAQRSGSPADRFRLELHVPRPPATPPGRRLPRNGANGSVSRLSNQSDAWWVRMREGTTYRVNLDPRATRCVALQVFPPGTRSFRDTNPVYSFRCGGYQLLTPRPGRAGRYFLVARATHGDRRPERYHVQVSPAGPDDTAPGIFIGNFARVRGFLEAGGIDVVDLYRFDVVRRSGLFLSLRTAGQMRMLLLNDVGKHLDSSSFLIRRGVPAGRYFVAIRSESDRRVPYTLSRISRTITRSRLTINGSRQAQAGPGAAVQVEVAVTPAVSGPVRVDVERFDPLAGWQFYRRFHSQATNGHASVSFVPPGVGRYRARGLFLRTRRATASATNEARLLVASPLEE